MDLNCYLAMTAAEFAGTQASPAYTAWMACHFSPTGKALSNQPQQLPTGSLLIVDDSIPPNGHDPKQIAEQLNLLIRELPISGIVLDLQRRNLEENKEFVSVLTQQPPCPVCVSAHYAEGLDCPVFLPPPPLHTPLSEHLAPWKDREIWLEAALETEQITVTKDGSTVTTLPFMPLPEESFSDDTLYCRYRIQAQEDHAIFTLTRDMDMLQKLMRGAAALGIQKAVGLYRELKDFL